MMMSWMVVLGFLLSLVTSGLIGFALFTYIKRNWWDASLDEGDDHASRVLDGIDRIEVRLTAMNERIERLEGRLTERGGMPRELSSGDGDGPDGT